MIILLSKTRRLQRNLEILYSYRKELETLRSKCAETVRNFDILREDLKEVETLLRDLKRVEK